MAVIPVERQAPDRERLRLIARRFGVGTLAAIGVLVVSGSAMAAHEHLWANGRLQLKLALVALVAALIIWHMRRPALRALDGAIFVVSLAIVWLGLALAHGY